jgi:hypothetical protein
MGWVVNATLRPLFRGKETRFYRTEGLVGPAAAAGLDRCGNLAPTGIPSQDRPLMQGSYRLITGYKTTGYRARKRKQEMHRCNNNNNQVVVLFNRHNDTHVHTNLRRGG